MIIGTECISKAYPHYINETYVGKSLQIWKETKNMNIEIIKLTMDKIDKL